MRQINWDEKLNSDDVAWLRQSGMRFGPGGVPMEDAIRENQGRAYESVNSPDNKVDRSALDPAAGAGVPFASLSEDEQRARLDANAGVSEEDQDVDDDYDDWNKDELQDEVSKRNDSGSAIEVTGSGKGGTVLKADLIKALRADDTQQSDAG